MFSYINTAIRYSKMFANLNVFLFRTSHLKKVTNLGCGYGIFFLKAQLFNLKFLILSNDFIFFDII